MVPPFAPLCRRSPAGFTLVETLVALTLLAVLLLGALAVLGVETRVTRRVEAHRQVLRVLEWELETLRAASSWPAAGELALGASPPAAAEGLVIDAEVEVLPGRHLRRVTLRARYTVHGEPFARQLETLIFNPP